MLKVFKNPTIQIACLLVAWALVCLPNLGISSLWDIDEGNNLYFTAARVRGNISGTGLITYNSNTGVISTTADNYSNWNVQTDSGVGSKHSVASNSTVIVSGGAGITVTNTDGNITIASTNSADIEAVSAGSGHSRRNRRQQHSKPAVKIYSRGT